LIIRALALFAGLSGSSAQAAGPLKGLPISQDTTTARYAADLVGNDGPKQTYAARVLRRRVRSAWRVAARNRDDLQTIEARQMLGEFDALVAPRCIRQLSNPGTLRPCAQILGMLETKAALEPLRMALAQSRPRCTRKAIERAIFRLEDAQ